MPSALSAAGFRSRRPATGRSPRCATTALFALARQNGPIPYRWAEITETLERGQPFHCHKGLPVTLDAQALTATFSAPCPGVDRMTVCAGWAASYMARFKTGAAA